MRDDEALPETLRNPNDAPHEKRVSRVRLRAGGDMKGSIEWLEAQQLLDELGGNQIQLDELLRTVDPSDDRVRSISMVREALAAIFRISAARSVQRAFLPEAPIAEYVVGLYSWLFAVIGALGESDPAIYAWRIEEASNFHFDELHPSIRADLDSLLTESSDVDAAKQLRAATLRLLTASTALAVCLDAPRH